MRVCIFGDSITWGANDFERGGWAERLKTHFMGGYEVKIENLGISGEKTEDMLKRFKGEALAREAEAIVFAVGINDSQYVNTKDNPRVPVHVFTSNVSTLLAEAKAVTKRVLVVGLTPVDEKKTVPVVWAPTKNYDNESIERYDQVLREQSDAAGVAYLTMKGVVSEGELEDGLHPNAEGHRKMFEQILPAVQKLIS